MQTIKVCNATEAKNMHRYTNIKRKLLRTNAWIWFNKQCQIKGLIPNYAHIKVKGNSIAAQKTQQQAIRSRISNEIKFQYAKIKKIK
jgi:hypothetical protein